MELNYVGILAAAVVAWLAGGAYYGVLGDRWIAAIGKTKADFCGADGKRKMPVGPMVLSFVANLVTSVGLAGLMMHLGGLTVEIGVITGAACWLAFVIPGMATGYAFQGKPLALTVIDGGNVLLSFVFEGLVIGLISL